MLDRIRRFALETQHSLGNDPICQCRGTYAADGKEPPRMSGCRSPANPSPPSLIPDAELDSRALREGVQLDGKFPEEAESGDRVHGPQVGQVEGPA